MRLDPRDAGSYRHQVKLLPCRPVLSRPYQRTTNATPTRPGRDNQPHDFNAFTGLQQHASLGGNPPDDA